VFGLEAGQPEFVESWHLDEHVGNAVDEWIDANIMSHEFSKFHHLLTDDAWRQAHIQDYDAPHTFETEERMCKFLQTALRVLHIFFTLITLITLRIGMNLNTLITFLTLPQRCVYRWMLKAPDDRGRSPLYQLVPAFKEKSTLKWSAEVLDKLKGLREDFTRRWENNGQQTARELEDVKEILRREQLARQEVFERQQQQMTWFADQLYNIQLSISNHLALPFLQCNPPLTMQPASIPNPLHPIPPPTTLFSEQVSFPVGGAPRVSIEEVTNADDELISAQPAPTETVSVHIDVYRQLQTRPKPQTLEEAITHVFQGHNGMPPFLQLWTLLDHSVLFGVSVKTEGTSVTSTKLGKSYVRSRESFPSNPFPNPTPPHPTSPHDHLGGR